MADDSRHGPRRRAPSGRRRGGRRRRPARHLRGAAGHGRRRGRASLDRVGHRARRPGRGVGAELARVDRRRARHHDRGRRARPDQHPLPRRGGGVRARRAAARARCSPCAGSSTPTTRRCSRAPAWSSRRSSTRSCSRASRDDAVDRVGRLPRDGDGGAPTAPRRAGRVDRRRRSQRRRVHLGNDRQPEGRRDDARPDAARVPRLVRLGRPACRRPLPDRESVLPHLRVQGRLPRVPHARRDDLPARGVRRRRSRSRSSSASGSRCSPGRRRSTTRSSTIPTARTRDISSLRVGVTGAADIPVELIRRVREELPVRAHPHRLRAHRGRHRHRLPARRRLRAHRDDGRRRRGPASRCAP